MLKGIIDCHRNKAVLRMQNGEKVRVVNFQNGKLIIDAITDILLAAA